MPEAENRRIAEPVQRYLVPNWHPKRLENALARVELRVRRRAQRLRLVLAVAATFMLLAAVALVIRQRSPADASEGNAALRAGADRVLRFSDGSSVRLEGPASRVDAGFASPDGVDVTLQAGAAHFEVTPQGRSRRFAVHAGVVDVMVVGTVFRVERSGSRVHVGVQHGRVEVRWPDGMRPLSAGESGWFPPESEAQPSNAGVEPAPEATPAPVTPAPVVDARTEHKRFVEHVNKGEYDEAFAMLERSPDVVGNSVGELLLAADAARLSNHPRQALLYLERIAKEHPKDARTPLAAFTMGRILMSQLAQPGRAADAFALTRRLAPGGPLAEDALAREVEAAERAGARDRARALSEEYVQRYPSGRRLPQLQRGLRQ